MGSSGINESTFFFFFFFFFFFIQTSSLECCFVIAAYIVFSVVSNLRNILLIDYTGSQDFCCSCFVLLTTHPLAVLLKHPGFWPDNEFLTVGVHRRHICL